MARLNNGAMQQSPAGWPGFACAVRECGGFTELLRSANLT
jgi:hypothetical protein